jgi:hypothetical protein
MNQGVHGSEQEIMQKYMSVKAIQGTYSKVCYVS